MSDVTEEDFQNPKLFGGVSPLNPTKLAEIVGAVMKAGPKAVGVDFDTSLWPPGSRETPALLSKNIPVVWAQAGVPGPEADSRKLDVGNGFCDSDGVCYGVPAYFPDEDGVVHEYQKFLMVSVPS